MLSVQSMTGYAVREAIRDVLGHFWNESFGQIYPTLAQLQRDGLVQRSQGERSGSSVYAIAAPGGIGWLSCFASPISLHRRAAG